MKRTNLRGHALQSEGKPYRAADASEDMGSYLEQGKWIRSDLYPDGDERPRHIGYALCECGATSPELESDGARKRWHRDVHKAEIRDIPNHESETER